jgi:hypothetical protein
MFFSGPQGVNPGESLGLLCRSAGSTIAGLLVCMCAAVVATDRFSAFGATAQPANSRVKSVTTVKLSVLRFSIVFFMP